MLKNHTPREKKEYVPIPPGVYAGIVVSIEPAVSQAGNDMFVVTYSVKTPEGMRTKKEYLVDADGGARDFAVEKLEQLRGPDLEPDKEFDTLEEAVVYFKEKIEHKHYLLRIEASTYKNPKTGEESASEEVIKRKRLTAKQYEEYIAKHEDEEPF